MIHKSIMPDVSGLLLVAGSWAPLAASWYEAATQYAQLIGVILGIIVSLMAIVDFGMKIHWKWKQIKKERRQKNTTDKDA